VTKNEDEFDDEEAEDEQEEVDEPQPESGPPLLSSVNEDDGQWFMPVSCESNHQIPTFDELNELMYNILGTMPFDILFVSYFRGEQSTSLVSLSFIQFSSTIRSCCHEI
jgi:hypothetical protein